MTHPALETGWASSKLLLVSETGLVPVRPRGHPTGGGACLIPTFGHCYYSTIAVCVNRGPRAKSRQS